MSTSSINQVKKELEKISNAYDKGCADIVEYATKRLYELVCANCSNYDISNPENRIHYEYDKNEKIGIVYSDDIVIIFNEFGTGIRGTQDEWANRFGYMVNKSGKGETGWWYPSNENDPNPYKWVTPTGEIRALTHGLESRHMFYDAFLQLQTEIDEIVEITIGKAIGDLY